MIVDVLAGCVPWPDPFAAGEATTRGRLRGYAAHFGSEAAPARSYAEVEERIAAEHQAASERAPGQDGFFAALDEAGIGLAAVYAERYGTALGVRSGANDEVASFVALDPDRVLGLAGIDPWEPDAATEVDRAVRELGLSGVVLSPFKQHLAAESPQMARVYGRCEALGVPVFLHTGVNWFLESDYDVGHPRGIDRVARAFPDLKVVALHAGWPWVLDMMMVAWRHPNVFVDISAHRPRHLHVAEAGWGPLLYYGSRMLADRIVFGSTWTLLGIRPAELINEVRALPLDDGVIDRWLGTNALRLFDRA